jgi:hypothetical protein
MRPIYLSLVAITIYSCTKIEKKENHTNAVEVTDAVAANTKTHLAF